MADHTLGIAFKFFQVKYSPQFVGTLKDILDAELALPDDKRNIVTVNKIERVLLETTIELEGNKAWLFSSKRMSGLPAKLNAFGKRESLNLNDDEGLGENTAIACDPTCSVAAIQSNQHAMSSQALAKIINKLSPTANIQFLPMLKVDALERLNKSKLLKKVRIKVAGVKSFEHLKDYGLSASQALELQKIQQSPEIDITWSMGKTKDSGLGTGIMDILKSAIGYKNSNPDTHEVKALEAVMQLEENGAMITDAVDFLTERLFYPAQVSLNDQREVDEDDLLRHACIALIEKKEEIKKYLDNAAK